MKKLICDEMKENLIKIHFLKSEVEDKFFVWV